MRMKNENHDISSKKKLGKKQSGGDVERKIRLVSPNRFVPCILLSIISNVVQMAYVCNCVCMRVCFRFQNTFLVIDRTSRRKGDNRLRTTPDRQGRGVEIS